MFEGRRRGAALPAPVTTPKSFGVPTHTHRCEGRLSESPHGRLRVRAVAEGSSRNTTTRLEQTAPIRLLRRAGGLSIQEHRRSDCRFGG
jgi:hypothetical protein